MPRLVRRKSFRERWLAWMNPMDFWLWASEEIQTRELDSQAIGTRAGLTLNFLYFLAVSNTGPSSSGDDVFGDSSRSGWLHYIAWFLRVLLTLTAIINAYWTFANTRRYRLFEADIETRPTTTSAHRVRVQSSPASSSPLRLLSQVLASETAESRAHPDNTQDVWELAVWDPVPLHLQFFCFFNPGHVIAYAQYLPLQPMDSRPSVTVFSCLAIQVILSAGLVLLKSKFTQQIKDLTIIHKEVFHEYDTKYVHPQLHPVVRDVGTQFASDDTGPEADYVEYGTPTTIIRRGFRTNPNPNYTRHLSYDDAGTSHQQHVIARTPAPKARYSDIGISGGLRRSSWSRQDPQSSSRISSPAPSIAPTPVPIPNHGGSLGVYTHVNSPLKKATSYGELKGSGVMSPRNSRELAALEQRELAEKMVRQSSPLKDGRRATTHFGRLGEEQPANPFANTRDRHLRERFPSLR